MSDQFEPSETKTGAEFPDVTDRRTLRVSVAPSGDVTFSSGGQGITVPTYHRAAIALAILGNPTDPTEATQIARDATDPQRHEFVEEARSCLYAAVIHPEPSVDAAALVAENEQLRAVIHNIAVYLKESFGTPLGNDA